MAKEFGRKVRVGELIQRELADILQHKVDFPKQGCLITIAGVDVSPDLRQAKVFITILGKDEAADEIIEALNDVAGAARYHLASRLTIRGTPKLTFVHDISTATGNRISSLLNQANRTNSDTE
jgi:ribosome-binding factor A